DRELEDRLEPDDPGRVDQTVGAGGGLGDALPLLGPREVGREHVRPRGGEPLETRAVDVDREYGDALTHQPVGRGAPHAPPCAGDDASLSRAQPGLAPGTDTSSDPTAGWSRASTLVRSAPCSRAGSTMWACRSRTWTRRWRSGRPSWESRRVGRPLSSGRT